MGLRGLAARDLQTLRKSGNVLYDLARAGGAEIDEAEFADNMARCLRRGPSPLDLVRWAAGKYPDLFRPALELLEGLDESAVENIVARVPDGWMSRPAREFATASMRHGLERMREMNR